MDIKHLLIFKINQFLYVMFINKLFLFLLKKVALITGITGQDGSYLAEFLLNKGYQVHGIKRRSSSFNTYRINHIYQDPHDKIVLLSFIMVI